VAHPACCKMGTGSFPWVKCGRGVLLTTHTLLVPRSRKSRVILLPNLWATPVLRWDHFTFTFIYQNYISSANYTIQNHSRKNTAILLLPIYVFMSGYRVKGLKN